MLCAHCHENDATVHITSVAAGAEMEKIDLCTSCAAVLGLGDLSPERAEELSVVWKRCEFCGRDAVSGGMVAGGPVYSCEECGTEIGRIIAEITAAERPDLMKRTKEHASSLAFFLDPELRTWAEATQAKAVQVLRERRRRERGDQKG